VPNPLTTRAESGPDRDVVRNVHRLAFRREDEGALVDALRDGGHGRVSLVAEIDGAVVGHVLFSEVTVLTGAGTERALSLAPLAVLPGFQGQGIGSALVRAGLQACRDQGHRVVIVLGHPHYYPRFGFSAKLAQPLASVFGARDSWMAAELVPGALAGLVGWVEYSPPFGIAPHVRPVHKSDRAEWLRMRVALWPDGGEGEHASEIAEFLDFGSFSWAKSLLALGAFVATRSAGGLCGFAEVSVRPFVEDCPGRPPGYLEGWYVDPDVRRRGIGAKLVAAAETWAAAQGCEEMASDAHLGNAASHAAHRALGFNETSRLVHFHKRLAAPDPSQTRRDS
jgi:putative acetyltransferase